MAGQPTPGYLEDIHQEESDTETFVAIRAEIANWRWAGVPFFLRTGKRLAARTSEIVVNFRPISHSIFDHTAGRISQNRLAGIFSSRPPMIPTVWLAMNRCR